MRLTRKEETELTTQGLLAVLLCMFIALGAYYGTNSQAQKTRDDAKSTISANENLLETNRKDAKEIKFLRENAKSIETMWSTLRGWGDGVKSGAVNPLVEQGLSAVNPLPTAKIPGNPSEYSGLRVGGDKTEFQRLVKALSEVEAEQGLMQVKTATIALPSGARPNAQKPTFLEIQLELVAPSTSSK